LFGKNFHLFKPKVPADHEDYELKVLERIYIFFGPFPNSYQDIADQKTLIALAELMRGVPANQLKPFRLLQDPDLSENDKAFLLKIMKLDPRDRPTAGQLLKDEWFSKDMD
jgi:serine/threonine protein kinase